MPPRGLKRCIAAVNSAFDLDQDLARVHPSALGPVNGGDFAGDGGLDFGFHLHRFGDQHSLARLDTVAFLDQHIDDVARHGGADVARCAGLLALAATTADEFVERLEHHFFRHAVDGQVEVTLAFSLDAHTGDVAAVGFAVDVDDELGGHP